MISTKIIGGLGNNLFQMSVCFAHAYKNKFDYRIPLKIENPHYAGQKPYISPNLKYTEEELILPIYKESGFHYTEIPLIDNICFDGYWQSYKYFSGYRSELLKALGFDDIQTLHHTCSCHYRSGDYKNYPTVHPIVSKEYIHQSMYRMYRDGYSKFLIFSNDIPEIKEIIESFPYLDNISVEYSEGKNEIEDLRLMASCSSNIIANSTFSWWAAYINPHRYKQVIYPEKWFGVDVKHDTKDLFMPNWIKI